MLVRHFRPVEAAAATGCKYGFGLLSPKGTSPNGWVQSVIPMLHQKTAFEKKKHYAGFISWGGIA